MRVQIRDCNPSHRGAWKSARGRGKPQQYAVQRPHAEDLIHSNPRYCSVPDHMVHDDHHRFDAIKRSGIEPYHHPGDPTHALTAAAAFPTLNNDPTVTQQLRSTPMPIKANTNGERLVSIDRRHGQVAYPNLPVSESATRAALQNRDWYEEPAMENSSLSSSLSVSTAVVPPPIIPCPIGFYPSPTWIPPPLPMPYMAGYAGLTLPAIQPNVLHGPDPSGPTTGWAPIGALYGVGIA